jgi:UDP-N-acetylglucosamine--N-acetylmuramyl-(pentapeptide) pyrophosphoryl-undecaprenol N-acetylglucosamine transferase
MHKTFAKETKEMKRIIISGGGTGGHIFPAIAIADALKKISPEVEILFIGAKGKMEMEKVPAAGYPIEGLWISGFQRRLTWKNLVFPLKVVSSLLKAAVIIRRFNPDVVIGVGGYASGPTLRMAVRKNIPTLIQEQNSFPGVTNRILGSKVDRICVAYSGMEKFFPKDRIVLIGNPVRTDLAHLENKRDEALKFFGLKKERLTIFIMGGSLGARTINKSIINCIKRNITQNGVQLLWQTGKFYFEDIRTESSVETNPDIHIHEFIHRMNLAFAAADIIVSRAGAIAISELCIVGKPVILIPSPNVTDDHQTKNARALESRNAAILLKNSEAENTLFEKITELIGDRNLQRLLSENIRKLAVFDAAEKIAGEAFSMIRTQSKNV